MGAAITSPRGDFKGEARHNRKPGGVTQGILTMLGVMRDLFTILSFAEARAFPAHNYPSNGLAMPEARLALKYIFWLASFLNLARGLRATF
jgi:hypothetical protein